MTVQRILRGLRHFQKHVYPKHRDLFQSLALSQRPEVLFITCADSRIDPCMLTQTQPGELFISRVIGNIIPPYPRTIGGVSATIEYAVAVLGVTDIIVCGHTDCGVMKGVMNPAAVKSLPSVSAWLKHAQAARRTVEKIAGQHSGPGLLLALTEQNVVEQLHNLRAHPAVAAGLDQSNLKLHGWVYHIAEGAVTSYDPEQQRFVPVPASPAEKTKVHNTRKVAT